MTLSRKRIQKYLSLIINFNKYLIILLVIFVLVFSGCQKKSKEKKSISEEPILLIFSGKEEEGGLQTLAVCLLQFSGKEKYGNIILIPQETEVVIPGSEEQRLGAAYVYGGGNRILEIVAKSFDLEIENYLVLSLSDLESWVQKFGGLNYSPQKIGKYYLEERDIDYSKPSVSLKPTIITDLFFFLNKPPLLNKGVLYDRVTLIKSFFEANLNSRFTRKEGSFLRQPSETNLSDEQLSELDKIFLTLSSQRIYFTYLPGEFVSEGDEDFWKVDSKEARKMIDIVKNKKQVASIFKVQEDEEGEKKEVESQEEEKEEVKEEVKMLTSEEKKSYKVSVLNGNGQAGAGARMTQTVQKAGWVVIQTDNAPNFNYLKSLVYYRQDKGSAAGQLAQDIDIEQVSPVEPNITTAADLIIIIGHDRK